MTFGLTPAGFNAKRLADIKVELENAFIAQFGDINLDPQSVFGQIIGVEAKSFADIWENLEDVYFSQYPNSASGVALDNVVQLNGISRLPATQTSVIATCGGLEGTYIPQNALATIPSSGAVFYANIGGSITSNNALNLGIQVGTVTTQPYTVILNNETFTYSNPIITFTHAGDIFVSSNSIIVTINGIPLAAVPFTTDSNTTLAAIATAISNFGSGSELVATATNPNIITIVPNAGFSAVIQMPINITGGSYQASSALTYQAPADDNAITSALTSLINVGTPNWLAIDNMNGTISVNSTSPSLPFIAQVGVNLSIISRTSPISFLSENYGPISCPANSLTNILTPIGGWNSITNTIAGITGTLTETDAALRLRRANSTKLLGNGTVEAIESHLLQNVLGVTSATVFENRTLTQQSYTIIFPSIFSSSDVVTVSYNDSFNFTVTTPSSPNQVTSMNLLIAAFEALPEVESASYGGTSNKTLTVNMNILQYLILNSVVTSVSTQTATITGGRPPKSFESVVQGGTDEAVANQIWESKPAGIETYGNTEVDITDSQGNTQAIFFSRPTNVYIWVEVALTLYAEETFPVNGLQLVQQAIYNYGKNLGVGIDVLFQRVLAQIFTVPGIASGDMQIAATSLLTQTPSYSTDDISITDTQISVFNLDIIFVTIA